MHVAISRTILGKLSLPNTTGSPFGGVVGSRTILRNLVYRTLQCKREQRDHWKEEYEDSLGHRLRCVPYTTSDAFMQDGWQWVFTRACFAPLLSQHNLVLLAMGVYPSMLCSTAHKEEAAAQIACCLVWAGFAPDPQRKEHAICAAASSL